MSDPRPRSLRFLTSSYLVLSIMLIAAACSGVGGPGGTSAPGASSDATSATAGSVCDDLDAFKASITALTQVDLSSGGSEALAAAVGDVKAAAEALKVSASAELASAIDTITTQIDALQTAVEQVGQGDPGAGLVAIGTAVAGLASAAQAFEAELSTACP